MVAFAFSSILTGKLAGYFTLQPQISLTWIAGLTFFLLGALRLGTLIGFFPRHILVGYVFLNDNNLSL